MTNTQPILQQLKDFKSEGIQTLATKIEEKLQNEETFEFNELINFDFEQFSKENGEANEEFRQFVSIIASRIEDKEYGFHANDFVRRNQMDNVFKSFFSSVRMGITSTKARREEK